MITLIFHLNSFSSTPLNISLFDKYWLETSLLEELDIVKRGRNYNRLTHPKNTDIITYKMATGFEALIGYLYFDDRKQRVTEIINYELEEYDEKNS